MSVPRGQGPLNDPSVVERRGDLSGLNALMFAVLVIVAFAAAGLVLWAIVHGAAGSPGPSAATPAVAAASVSPSLNTSVPTSPGPTPAGTTAGGSAVPSPTGPVQVVIGVSVPLTVNGAVVGKVTVLDSTYRAVFGGRVAPKGKQWLTIEVWYEATAPLSYDAADWVAIDGAGNRQSWTGHDPRPPLGKGTLKAGGSIKGNVTFAVAAKLPASAVVLTSPQGTDLIFVTLL
jgi:hypothetical protein